uniref:SFRICE_008498 n=1 Tax=Spodoptera frugiperda TaxID=7108 RepID=A0A2H1V413_SPOFR
MLEAHIHEQHSATHDAAIVALLLLSPRRVFEFLVKQIRAEYIHFVEHPVNTIIDCTVGTVAGQLAAMQRVEGFIPTSNSMWITQRIALCWSQVHMRLSRADVDLELRTAQRVTGSKSRSRNGVVFIKLIGIIISL